MCRLCLQVVWRPSDVSSMFAGGMTSWWCVVYVCRWYDVLVMYPRSNKVKTRRSPTYVAPKSTATTTTTVSTCHRPVTPIIPSFPSVCRCVSLSVSSSLQSLCYCCQTLYVDSILSVRISNWIKTFQGNCMSMIDDGHYGSMAVWIFVVTIVTVVDILSCVTHILYDLPSQSGLICCLW